MRRLFLVASIAASAATPVAATTYLIDFDALSERGGEVAHSFRPNPDPALPAGVLGPGVAYTHHDTYFNAASGTVQAYLDGVLTATTRVVAFGGAQFDALSIDVIEAYSTLFLKEPGLPATENVPLPPGVLFTGIREDGSVATLSMPVPQAPGSLEIGLTDLVSLTFAADIVALTEVIREVCGPYLMYDYRNCVVGLPGYEMVATFDNLALDIRGFVAPVPTPPPALLQGALAAVLGGLGLLRRHGGAGEGADIRRIRRAC